MSRPLACLIRDPRGGWVGMIGDGEECIGRAVSTVFRPIKLDVLPGASRGAAQKALDRAVMNESRCANGSR